MILVQRLNRIEDPRVTGRCDHVLVDILLIALCATIAGAEGLTAASTILMLRSC